MARADRGRSRRLQSLGVRAYQSHHRFLLKHIARGHWFTLGPSHEMVIHDLGAARKGFVGVVSKMLGFWLRHSGTKKDRGGKYTKGAPGLEMDTGGWVSVRALINRLDAVQWVGNNIRPYFILGIVWGCRKSAASTLASSLPPRGGPPSSSSVQHRGAPSRSSSRSALPPLAPTPTL